MKTHINKTGYSGRMEMDFYVFDNFHGHFYNMVTFYMMLAGEPDLDDQKKRSEYENYVVLNKRSGYIGFMYEDMSYITFSPVRDEIADDIIYRSELIYGPNYTEQKIKPFLEKETTPFTIEPFLKHLKRYKLKDKSFRLDEWDKEDYDIRKQLGI